MEAANLGEESRAGEGEGDKSQQIMTHICENAMNTNLNIKNPNNLQKSGNEGHS